MRHPSPPRRPQPRAWHRSPPSSADYSSSQARRPPRTSRPASATPGPKATVFPSSCASRAGFGWRTIAQQSLPLLSAAAPLQRRAASTRRFSPPAPAPKATIRRGRARQRSRPRARRSRRMLLLSPRTRKRRSRRIAATRTGMALRPGARSGSTIGQRAVTRQGSETTSGAHTVAGASRPISGKVRWRRLACSNRPARAEPESLSQGWAVSVSEDHTDNLKKARARLIEQRRAFVKVLAGPYERGKTEQARERFLEMQTAIEAMDRAIEDEEGSQGSVYDRS